MATLVPVCNLLRAMAATESDMPYEVGLIKQGCWEMISMSHPAVLNLDQVLSDIHEGVSLTYSNQSKNLLDWIFPCRVVDVDLI